MPRRLPLRVAPSAVSMARAIRVAAAGAPMLCVTARAFNNLATELGGFEAAVGGLLAIAEANNRPIGVNFATGVDTSRSAFIGPRSWSER